MSAKAQAWQLDFDVFLKAPSSIIGPGSEIRLPDVAGEVHYEAELALVIGRGGRDIAESEALAHVLGYTILLDVTLRGDGDRSRRKSYDGFTPIGPWLTTADDVPDWRELGIRLWLNGEQRQSVRAGEMTVSVPAIVAYASRVMTLRPGDVIATGAPPGVGRIVPGDRVRAEIGGLGSLEVTVASG
jgi:2-keto-4-pentenoate hydratase/2-oxohepta-3-ene-1,7-dioic acid hydratase in catechol pathway